MNTLTIDPYYVASQVDEAAPRLSGVVARTPLVRHTELSARFRAEVYLKREDLQSVRSYKIRGAYNALAQLTVAEKAVGVVCASAGNHAQGFAWSAQLLGINGTVFMPKNTPRQKIARVEHFGGTGVKVVLVGETYDAAYEAARAACDERGAVFIHPFDDLRVVAGQGTIAREILEDAPTTPAFVFVPAGGGGLLSGVGSYLKAHAQQTRVIAVEPLGAQSLAASLAAGKRVTLPTVDTFVDGAAVRTIGEITHLLAGVVVDRVLPVPEGKVCEEMVKLYQESGIVTEPAGALSVAALDYLAPELVGTTVVCIISGGNNDISRYTEVLERSLVYRGLKHYFVISFSQRPGALRSFLNDALGPNDDITLFEYVKKNNRENGPALVGIELATPEDLLPLIKRMDTIGIGYEKLSPESPLYRFIV